MVESSIVEMTDVEVLVDAGVLDGIGSELLDVVGAALIDTTLVAQAVGMASETATAPAPFIAARRRGFTKFQATFFSCASLLVLAEAYMMVATQEFLWKCLS